MMNELVTLPESSTLPVATFAKAFDNVNSSHKFLWMLAILAALQSPAYRQRMQPFIPLSLLVYGMLETAQKTLVQFRLEEHSRSDRFQHYLELCQERSRLFVDNNPPADRLEAGKRIPRADVLQPITAAYAAPYRFLAPFVPGNVKFTKGNVRPILAAMAVSDAPAPYHFSGDGESIVIHPNWMRYFVTNANVVRGWTLWHWARYLESRNPNTPSLTAKIAGVVRGSLDAPRRLWDKAIILNSGKLRCIYSGEALALENYSIDHYLPWEFVGHDSFWNLVPTLRHVNSSKSNILPDESHLEKLVDMHGIAIKTYHEQAALRPACSSLMLSYQTDLHLPAANALPEDRVILEAYQRVIPALTALAKNQGFKAGWRYRA